MGVKGLWKLIECSGVPVPLETLEHKILSVDVSIWLHQAVRGFRGPGGAAVANAHLLTLFHRICKLLFYRIRPVFVFDGGVPHLKKQTLASRRLRREVAANKAKQVRERLLSNLMKSQAVRNALGRTGPAPSAVHVIRKKPVQKDIFELPPLPEDQKELIKSEQDEDEKSVLNNYQLPNLHHFDFESESFKSLPLESQHEILSELQNTRKENSWNTLNNMPQESTSFAEFQMGRLMKRFKFQSTLDDIRSEMQKKKSAEMEAEMFGELEQHVSFTQRIISEDAAHSIFIKKVGDKEEESVLVPKDEKVDYKGKTPTKRTREDFERDFLTELEKQGIVNSRRFSDSDSDSDIDDYSPFGEMENCEDKNKEKLNFDGQALLKVVNSLLDNDGLSQDEILALIKQNGPSEVQSKPSLSIDGPSTSGKAPGFVFNPDADSSDGDSDFIEVSEPSSPSVLLDEKSKENGMSKEDPSIDNVKKILETKNNSQWIKIMQQKLDDVVHTNTKSSPRKALIDSRNFGVEKDEVNEKSSNERSSIVKISLDFDIAPMKTEDDIFSDVFDSCRTKEADVKPIVERKKPHSNLEAITRKLSRFSDIQEKQRSSPQSAGSSVKGNIQGIESKNKSNSIENVQVVNKLHSVDKSNVGGTSSSVDAFKKFKELQELGKTMAAKKVPMVELMSSSDDSDLEESEEMQVADKSSQREGSSLNASSQNSLRNFEEYDEAAVDDVEIMSSSEDSVSDVDMEIGAKGLDTNVTEKVKWSEKTDNVINLAKPLDCSTDDDDVGIKVQESNGSSVVNIQNAGAGPRSVTSTKVQEEVSISNIEKTSTSNIQKPSPISVLSCSPEQSVVDVEEKVVEVSRNGIVERAENGKILEDNNSASSSNLASVESSGSEKAEEIVSEEPERPLDYSEDELKRLEGELADEQRALVAQAQKVERISSNLNDQMYGEAQHLLQLFGIPYLVAPMEAEAQCGYLDAINLTAGSITDDSDIFLFGGTKVYKNFFNQTKHVEFFKMDNIAANLGLSRDKMITLALLTGSDYTEGIESVGAVSAMEVLTEFPGEGIDCLRAFKKWWNVAHRNVSTAYFSKVKQKMTQVHLPESFPSENVVKAYLEPEVDESREIFSWAVPNVDALRQFTMEKFGWNREKADEILLPVMKKLGVKATQMRIDSFFTNVKLVKDTQIQSKRMKDAIAKAKGEEPPSLKESPPFKRPRNSTGKKAPAKRRKVEKTSKASEETMEEEEEEEEDEDAGVTEEIQVKKPSRTLLIDPSESRSGPEVPREKPKPKAKAKGKKKEVGNKKAGGPALSMRQAEEEEYVPPRKLTKEIMYEALNKKSTISQRESEKQQMNDKKKLAAEILKNTVKGKKKK